MIQTFTPDDVLKAQSGELSAEDAEQLNASIKDSAELQEFAETADLIAKEMPKMLVEPTEKPLKNIMAFVRNQTGK